MQIGRADLGQPAVEAQAAEPDRRVRARDDHEAQRRRRVAHEPFEILVHGVDDLVEVVQHEHDRLPRRPQRVGERRQHQVHAHGLARADRQRRDASSPVARRAPRGPRARSGGDRRRRCRARARRRVPAGGLRRSTSSAARSCRHRPARPPGSAAPAPRRRGARAAAGAPRGLGLSGDRELRRQERVGGIRLGMATRSSRVRRETLIHPIDQSTAACVRRSARATPSCAPETVSRHRPRTGLWSRRPMTPRRSYEVVVSGHVGPAVADALAPLTLSAHNGAHHDLRRRDSTRPC